MFLPRTFAVTDRLLKDIDRVLYWTIILVQSIFFVYYGYSIYVNIADLLYLVAYSLLIVLSGISFVYYLISYHQQVKHVTVVKRSSRIGKYVVNASMILFNAVQITQHGGSDISFALLILSATSLVIQVVIECVRVFASFYIDLYKIAIDKDTQVYQRLLNFRDVKGNLLGIVDAPLQMVHNRYGISEEDISEKERLVEALYEGRKVEHARKRNEKHKAHAKRQKEEIKEHLGFIGSTIKKKVKQTFKRTSKK